MTRHIHLPCNCLEGGKQHKDLGSTQFWDLTIPLSNISRPPPNSGPASVAVGPPSTQGPGKVFDFPKGLPSPAVGQHLDVQVAPLSGEVCILSGPTVKQAPTRPRHGPQRRLMFLYKCMEP